MKLKVKKKAKDWVGNKKSVFTTLGASNHSKEERAEHDYYATDPIAATLLHENFPELNEYIWECACGEGHLSKEFIRLGHQVTSSDLIDRNYGEVIDFLKVKPSDLTSDRKDYDIVTNPPYKYAMEFVMKALSLIEEGNHVCMFLKLTFLEGKARRKLFDKCPPKYLLVSSSRINCAKNGDFDKAKEVGAAVAYGWFIWEKGNKEATRIKWIN